MARIAGVDLPDEKRTDIGLTYVYGIGRTNVYPIIKAAGVDGAKRVKDLTDDEVNKFIESNREVMGDTTEASPAAMAEMKKNAKETLSAQKISENFNKWITEALKSDRVKRL